MAEESLLTQLPGFSRACIRGSVADNRLDLQQLLPEDVRITINGAQSRSSGTRSYRHGEWASMKPAIEELHVNRGRSLEDVMLHIYLGLGFKATYVLFSFMWYYYWDTNYRNWWWAAVPDVVMQQAHKSSRDNSPRKYWPSLLLLVRTSKAHQCPNRQEFSAKSSTSKVRDSGSSPHLATKCYARL